MEFIRSLDSNLSNKMRTFTQLVGTIATTSPSTYGSAFTTLANNNSSSAVAIGKSLVNDQHRYLLQKYFDNERTVTISTIGGETLALTGTIAIAPNPGTVVSATLSAVWSRISCQQYVNFSDGSQRYVTFTNGSASITWTSPLVNTVILTTVITTAGVQDYNIPADVSKIKDDTINVGQLKFHPIFVKSIQEWNSINFLPYKGDIVNYCFIYNGKISFFPIPSTTGNIITFNYKIRVIDMTYSDYATGTLATAGMTVGSTTVTGVGTGWTVYPQNVDLTSQNLYIMADVATGGDGIWYPILKFTSATVLTLTLPVISAPNITTATTYTIGQMPLLSEDFHDMMVYGALKVYFSTVVTNESKFKEYDALYKDRLELLKDYAGTKSVNVDLETEPSTVNPNLFYYANS